MSPYFYVVGGQQKQAFTTRQEEFTRFGTAVVAQYHNDLNGEIILNYKTPAEFCASDNGCSILFKSGSISNNKMFLCTQTEILIYRLPTFKRMSHISLPCFNDVHHVVENARGNLLVAVTGLDMIIEVDYKGTIIHEWDALGRVPWQRFSKDIDYRKLLTTKPHESHPNFVFEYGNDIWTSRFEQKDAYCLTNPEKRINIEIERPHDGHVLDNLAYFTTVDGHVVIANLDNLEIERVIDLQSCDPHRQPTGWARGLKLIDKDHVLIGFSTLRVTTIRENIRWIKKRFGLLANSSVAPTHVALYNLSSEQLIWRKVLDDPKIDVIFSIL